MILPGERHLPLIVRKPVQNIEGCEGQGEEEPGQPVYPGGWVHDHAPHFRLCFAPLPEILEIKNCFIKSLLILPITWLERTQYNSWDRREGFGSVCVWAAREEHLRENIDIFFCLGPWRISDENATLKIGLWLIPSPLYLLSWVLLVADNYPTLCLL